MRHGREPARLRQADSLNPRKQATMLVVDLEKPVELHFCELTGRVEIESLAGSILTRRALDADVA